LGWGGLLLGALLLAAAAPLWSWGEGAMLYVLESTKSVEQVGKALEEAVARHKFGVLQVHDLRASMAKKGVEFAWECRIYEICNPHQARRVLEQDMELSTVLPCRIAVYTDQEGTKLATVRPAAMIGMFGKPALQPVAEEVERTVTAIMREAAA
jgi:uncharacterized protein (DUF302 family)